MTEIESGNIIIAKNSNGKEFRFMFWSEDGEQYLTSLDDSSVSRIYYDTEIEGFMKDFGLKIIRIIKNYTLHIIEN